MQDLCALTRRLSSWRDQDERASAGRRCQDGSFPRLGYLSCHSAGYLKLTKLKSAWWN